MSLPFLLCDELFDRPLDGSIVCDPIDTAISDIEQKEMSYGLRQ